MRYTLDSSVAIKWVLPEIDSDRANRLRDDVRGGIHRLIAPDIFPIEVAHALTRAERQGRIPVGDAIVLWSDVMGTLSSFARSRVLLPRAIAISSRFRVGVYDCLYVALAEREGCELVTADAKLVKNLRPAFPFITELSALP
jgi:predicted nucleic acid-binding protein